MQLPMLTTLTQLMKKKKMYKTGGALRPMLRLFITVLWVKGRQFTVNLMKTQKVVTLT